MHKPSKEAIIEAYNDLVSKRGGKPVGEGVFRRETGVSSYYWNGGFWRSWSEFQANSGHVPNSPTDRIEDETLLHRFAELALKEGRIPTQADLKLKKKEDPSFPGVGVFQRWGDRDTLLVKVAKYCEGNERFAPVLERLNRGFSAALITESTHFVSRDSYIFFGQVSTISLVELTRPDDGSVS